MVIYLIAMLVALSVALVTVGVVQILPARSPTITRRLAELEEIGNDSFGLSQRRARQSSRQQLEAVLEKLGDRLQREEDVSAVRLMMIQAGIRNPSAPAIYRAIRFGFPIAFVALALVLAPAGGRGIFMMMLALAAFSWMSPTFYVGGKLRRRQHELRKALPDALDALVVCVEAGLGLNQAMVRVSEEIRHISTLMSEELTFTNLEIRAGTPREEALRNLADRTGLDDIRALVTMLIQTDRFGTSIAQALRVQADTLREKRRQRAEEAAAKTSIKMLFPLIFFIFPAMWVITLGPAVIQLVEGWTNRPIP